MDEEQQMQAAMDQPAYSSLPRYLVQAVIDIREDIANSDGDNRGMHQALLDAERDLINAAIEDIT